MSTSTFCEIQELVVNIFALITDEKLRVTREDICIRMFFELINQQMTRFTNETKLFAFRRQYRSPYHEPSVSIIFR